MKKFRYIVMAVTAAVVFAFVSCKKDNEKPSINVMDEGEKWSVSAILDSLGKVETFLFDEYEPASVDAYVIGDERTGNIYRTIYIRDEKGGCIAVYRNSGTEDFQAHAGDYITLDLSGAVAGYYNGLPQIQLPAAGVEPDPNVRIIIRQRNVDIIPTPATLKEVNEGKHLCDLVKLSDVQFSDPNHTYAEYESSSDRGIEDCSGYSAVVRTSNYATFASDSLPKGKGDLVCVVSLYKKSESNKTWQMLIRNTSDVNMNGPRCGQIGIFSEPFSSGQGDFTIQNVFMAQGLSWVWKYKSPYGMVASAFANNTSYESESWLISPAIDMNGFSSAVLTFEHAANKLSNGSPADYYSVWVSTDYADGLPETATWTQLTVPTYPAGTNWTFVASGDIDMSAYLGNNNVRIAFRYTSEDGNSGSWEIKNVLINE